MLDAYGTLFDVAVVAQACAEATPEPERFAALWRRKQLEYTWLRNSMGRHADFEAVTADALDHVAERLAVTLDPLARERLLDAWLHVRPFPEVVAALEDLGGLTRLAILSNGTPRMLVAALAAAGLHGRFEAVLSVEEAGTYKPDPRAYALAGRALSLAGQELLFVSSNAWDVAGAAATGLSTAYVNRTGVPADRLDVRDPVAVVRDLTDLLSVVRGDRLSPA